MLTIFSHVEVRCPKQPYGWPAVQPLLDGTTPVANRNYEPGHEINFFGKEPSGS